MGAELEFYWPDKSKSFKNIPIAANIGAYFGSQPKQRKKRLTAAVSRPLNS
jgi:hypothetical protein